MALSNGFVTTAGTSALDARLFEQALLVKNINDVPRQGLLYGDINPVKATSSFSVSIASQIVFALSRGNTDGVNVITVLGTTTVALTPAPSANSRYDAIYVKHNDTEKGDASSSPVIDKVTGVAAASPTVPSVPAGAMLVATVLVPAGVTATNASGVVISNVVPATALYGSPIRYRSLAEMRADTSNVIDGTQGYIKSGGLYWMRGGSWMRDDAQPVALVNGSGTLASGTSLVSFPTQSNASLTTDASYIGIQSGAQFIAGYAGFYDFAAAVNWNSNSTGERYLEITVNDNSVPAVRVTDRRAASGSSDATFGALLQLNAGDRVTLKGWQTSGSTLQYSMRFSARFVASL